MARRKHSKPRQLDISFQGEKAPEAQPEKLHVFPFELRPGDRVTDPEGREWEVTTPSRLPTGQDGRGSAAQARGAERGRGAALGRG
jgi:hypothetical protein